MIDNVTRNVAGLTLAATFFLFASGARGATICVDPKTAACLPTIGAAVTAAQAGDTIQVQAGTYHEDVTITKRLALIGSDQGTTYIDATGLANGIFVNGMGTTNGVFGVTISGFTVENANFEGILLVNATGATVWGNKIVNNNKSLNLAEMTCPGQPEFETNEDLDCGEGIHLIGVDHSTIARNDVENNSGGILISDETGPTYRNVITGNLVANNPYDCGITLASHGPAPSTGASLPFGVYDNTISQNQVTSNGILLPGAGAGVGIFAPFPGTRNSGNVVVGNQLSYNGLPGITMHNHAASPGAPAVNMNDNQFIANVITRNGADSLDAATPGPTGINIFSVAPVTGTVVSQNTVGQEAVDFAFNVPSGTVEAHLNNFQDIAVGVANLGTGTINATQNFWNCAAGPNTFGCGTTSGPNILTAPALTRPF
jgi:parallel beta-helix repeat protein